MMAVGFSFLIPEEDVERIHILYTEIGVQTTAGIFAIIISLSLMAIQFAAQEYSHRIMEYQDAGASCAVMPGFLQIAALSAQRAVLEELKAKGTVVEYLKTLPHAEEMTQFYNQQGADELARIESEYGGAH